MPDTFARPTTSPCPSTVELADGSRLDVTFWLLSDPARARGYTPLDVLLDGPREFLAVGLAGGESALLARTSILSIDVDAGSAGAPEMPGLGASLDVVTLHLDSGAEVSGVLRTWAPEGAPRMSDVFNAPSRFVPVGLGSRIALVNKARIVRVTF